MRGLMEILVVVDIGPTFGDFPISGVPFWGSPE